MLAVAILAESAAAAPLLSLGSKPYAPAVPSPGILMLMGAGLLILFGRRPIKSRTKMDTPKQ